MIRFMADSNRLKLLYLVGFPLFNNIRDYLISDFDYLINYFTTGVSEVTSPRCISAIEVSNDYVRFRKLNNYIFKI